MEINIEADNGSCRMRVEGDMTIYGAVELKKTLIEGLCSHERTELDLSGVDEIDTAGVQALILAERESRLIGREFRIASVSQPVASILKLYNLHDSLMADRG